MKNNNVHSWNKAIIIMAFFAILICLFGVPAYNLIKAQPKLLAFKDLGLYGSTQGLLYKKECKDTCVPSEFLNTSIAKKTAFYPENEDFMYQASGYLSLGIMLDKLTVEQKNTIITKIKNGMHLKKEEEQLLDSLWYSSIWSFYPEIVDKLIILPRDEAFTFYVQLNNDFNNGYSIMNVPQIEHYIKNTSQSDVYLKKMMSRLIELDIIKANSNEAKSLYVLIDLKK